MKFLRDLYYAMATGALIGLTIGIYRRRAQERREAEAAGLPPVNQHRRRRAYRPRRRVP